ncbi:MAG: sulfite exporter TauE/SafE family protein, partial [Alphaproteobacteria bacterium]|nr:sulfite exporter TauE/SafE family protein [Alphaproteobacteria bacterium]
FWGAVAGFTTFIAHAGAPPFSVYMLPQKLHRTLFQATSALFFATVNLVKLGPYAQLGLLNGGNLWTSLALAPLVPVGMVLGIWLHKKVSDALFVGIIYAALLFLGVKLTWDGVSGLYF